MNIAKLGFIDGQGLTKEELMKNRFKCLRRETNKVVYILLQKYKLDKYTMPCWYENRTMTIDNFMKLAADAAFRAGSISRREKMTHWKRFLMDGNWENQKILAKNNPMHVLPGAEGIMLELGWDRCMSNTFCLRYNT